MTEPYSSGRVPGKDRAVLLVLLTGARNLTHVTICQAAGIPPGSITPVLARLESAGWAVSDRDPFDLRRRFYSLTDAGRWSAMRLLGLEEPS